MILEMNIWILINLRKEGTSTEVPFVLKMEANLISKKNVDNKGKTMNSI